MTEERNRDRGTFERTGEAMGEMAGAVGESAGRMAGRAADAAVGAAGRVFDSMAAALGSWWSGPAAGRAAEDFGQTSERACEQHFQARSSGRDYTTTRPLYQFGHVAGQNPDYQGRSFSEIEPELRQAWESGPSRQYGRWDDVRDYVGFGFGSTTSEKTGGL